MDNKKALNYRQQLVGLQNFNIKKLLNMPPYFGFIDYYINKQNKIHMFLGGNDDGVALRCFWNKQYEKKTLEIWAKCCSTEGIIIDIGAHSGIYSLVANKYLNNGKVLSFEPHFLNFSRLNLNLRANGFSTSTIFMKAVGHKNEVLPFSVNSNLDYLTSGGQIGNIQNQVTSTINTTSIDNILDEVAKQSVKTIKIDVEGYEYKCLLGMLDTIKKSNPIIFFECISSKNNTEIELFLKKEKYTIFIVDDLKGSTKQTNKVSPILDLDNNIIHDQINRVALPKSKIDLIAKIFT